jgi:signal transduction histidine kinase
MVCSIILGLLVFISNKKILLNKLFFILTLLFSTWVFFDLVLWATGSIEFEMFFWAIIVPVEFFIFITSFLLAMEFMGRGKINILYKILFSLFFVPILLFTHTKYNLLAFDFTNCDRAAIEGPLITYLYIIEGIIFIMMIGEIIYTFVKSKGQKDVKELVLFSSGIITFLGLFIIGNITIVQDMGWGYEQYKLFGMVAFLSILVFIIVKFKAFDIKLIATQALVWSSIILIGAQFAFIQVPINRILTAVTLIITSVLGYFLVGSVKKEDALNEELAIANAGQTNLIHIMNHQIKGYLSISKNIFAELLTDDYGKVPEEAKDLISQGLENADKGTKYVTAVLKGESAENGKLVFDMKLFDLKKLASEVVAKEKEVADKKGLKLSFDVDGGDYNIMGDIAHLGEAVRNLIDNSINYTPTGSISINLSIKGTNILFRVKDTGVGVKEEDKSKLFKAGGVGSDSIKINTNSSGYGLAFVKGVIENHKGKVWFESEGAGKGSTFYIELPVK